MSTTIKAYALAFFGGIAIGFAEAFYRDELDIIAFFGAFLGAILIIQGVFTLVCAQNPKK